MKVYIPDSAPVTLPRCEPEEARRFLVQNGHPELEASSYDQSDDEETLTFHRPIGGTKQ